jgi:hypothetical protein
VEEKGAGIFDQAMPLRLRSAFLQSRAEVPASRFSSTSMVIALFNRFGIRRVFIRIQENRQIHVENYSI